MSHIHGKDGSLTVFFVPASTDLKPELKVIDGSLRAMQGLVEGYIEVVRYPGFELACGCSLSMVVNEAGMIEGLPINKNLDLAHPFLGDVFWVGEGLVFDGDETDIDFFSLPPEFLHWDGSSRPLPTPKQPWDE